MALIARDAVLGPLTGAPGAQFDATKFSWLGTPAIETNVCIAYHTSAVKTAQDNSLKSGTVGMIVNLNKTEVAFKNLLLTRN